MSKILLFLLLAVSLIACQQNSTEQSTPPTKKASYPSALIKVFNSHGGLDLWNSKEELSFNMLKGEQSEQHITQLRDRREYIKGSNFETGYDGTNYWLKADTSAYKGNPKFYHNLMFYFYAMPFVLADPGIIYSEVDSLSFEGKNYPGIAISYQDSVGISPEDEYFIYYDPDTYQMKWLGYTVTYFSGEKSDRRSFIQYTDWQKIDGILLPKTLTWFKSEEGQITEARNSRSFDNVQLFSSEEHSTLYKIPEGGEIIP